MSPRYQGCVTAVSGRPSGPSPAGRLMWGTPSRSTGGRASHTGAPGAGGMMWWCGPQPGWVCMNGAWKPILQVRWRGNAAGLTGSLPLTASYPPPAWPSVTRSRARTVKAGKVNTLSSGGDTTPGRDRRRPAYTAGPEFQRVCAPCNPPGSPFVAAVPWVVRGRDTVQYICEGCGMEVI